MTGARAHCKRCGHFTRGGRLLCDLCEAALKTVKDLEAKNAKCQERLSEFVGKDGRSWRIKIREQSFTLPDHARARDKAKALLDLGLWFVTLEEA